MEFETALISFGSITAKKKELLLTLKNSFLHKKQRKDVLSNQFIILTSVSSHESFRRKNNSFPLMEVYGCTQISQMELSTHLSILFPDRSLIRAYTHRVILALSCDVHIDYYAP